MPIVFSFFVALIFLTGCSTMIDKDTKLSLKGPKAEIKRVF